jgi:HSP20 family molecular chaperone IbpA
MATQETTIEKRETQTPAGTERLSERKLFMPHTDIYETDAEIVVVADMPGVDEKSVDITLEKNFLTITGTADDTAAEGRRLAYAEYETGDYQRTFTLSDEVDREGIAAVVKNGVLRLTLPKAAQARAKRIAVRAG